jgi:hypothetical protein
MTKEVRRKIFETDSDLTELEGTSTMIGGCGVSYYAEHAPNHPFMSIL